MTATDALPKELALGSLLDSNPLVANMRYVLVPLEADKTMGPTDSYMKWTQDDLIKRLQLKGINATVVAPMDRSTPAWMPAISVATTTRPGSWSGAAGTSKTIKKAHSRAAPRASSEHSRSFRLPGRSLPASSTRRPTPWPVSAAPTTIPSHAEIDLTLLNCDGKRVWGIEGTGETSHFSGHNLSAGETGAIDLAVASAVDGLAGSRH